MFHCFVEEPVPRYPKFSRVHAQALVPHPVNHNQSAKGHAGTYEIIMNGTGPSSFVGAIDQGTTSSRFLIFNNQGEVVVTHQLEFTQIYPRPGYVSLA